MKIQERYATAIRSSCLDVDERTTYSDTDVLGSYGLAAKVHPLAVALERLFSGDNGAATEIVETLADLAWRRAIKTGIKLRRVESVDMARACLAWHRDGTCKDCGGHGQMVIKGSTTIGGAICKACRGTGRIPFERQFKHEWRALAAWLVAEMECEQGRAGPAAMRKLAPKLDF